ncbi:MAG: MBL fold metallo-hydrolase [Pseudomonadales bacterium]|nr:MBL fold metallo-hydrolase [Pseudomonadales bacterium]
MVNAITAILLLLAAAVALQSYGAVSPDGNGATKDENGRFTNGVGEVSHGSFSVRARFILRRLATYFRSKSGAPKRIANDGQRLRDDAGAKVPAVTWIGHSSLLIQMDQVTFLTDPIWSNRPSPIPFIGPSRFVEPGLAIDDLPPIDFVLISHNHYDHLDVPTLKVLAERNSGTKFFVPLGNAELLRNHGITRVEELDWQQSSAFLDVTVYCLPAQHWSKRGLIDDNRALWASWAVIGPDKRFYFAGDTGYFSGFKSIGRQLGPFDLAAVPIGAYEPRQMMRDSHMNPEEAVLAARDLKADKALAMHFGTFDLSDEPLAEPPQRFAGAAAKAGVSGAWILNVGETRHF